MESPFQHTESLSLSPEKAELLALESEGKYLFHGSGNDVETLEPRQAVDTREGPDGQPAVFASDKADFAIFHAIVNRNNCPNGSTTQSGAFHHEDGTHTLDFGMSRDTADHLPDSASGWVYLFDRDQFQPHPTKKGVEFVSFIPVTAFKKIKVSKRDLPTVRIFESEE